MLLRSVDNTIRCHSSQDFYKNKEQNEHPDLLRLQVSNNEATDETIIRFIKSSTENHDSEFDAIKYFSYYDNLPQLYSTTSKNNPQNLTINTLPTYKNRIVDLGFKTNTAGEFTINSSKLNFEEGVNIYLIDKYKKTYQNLRDNPTYSFYSEIGNYEDRFQISFVEITTEIEKIETILNIYSYDNEVKIIQNNQELEILHIKIHNITGKLVKSQKTSNHTTTIFLPTTGIYIVNIVTENSIINKKVFIK